MKKVLAIFLLGVVVLSQTETLQFFKLIALSRHYTEHAQADPALTFGTFIFSHYVNAVHSDNDGKKDHELPFKSSSTSILTGAVIPPEPLNSFFYLIPSGACAVVMDTQEPVASGSGNDIWQPPRCV